MDPSQTQTTNLEVERFLTFGLAGERYAVPLLKVKEVIGYGEITPIPYTPPHFLGIMNLRGQVISIIDLRERLKVKKAEKSSETSIVILELHQVQIGVVVDSIENVLLISGNEILPRPELETRISPDFISGVARSDKKLVLILNIEKTLDVADLKSQPRAA